MSAIPIAFEWNGKVYKGSLEPWGMDGKIWYLKIGGKHRGQLMKAAGKDWNFYTDKGAFPDWAKLLVTFLPNPTP